MLAKKVWLLRRRRFTVWSLGFKVELVRVLRGDSVLGFMFLLFAVIAILLHVHAFTLEETRKYTVPTLYGYILLLPADQDHS